MSVSFSGLSSGLNTDRIIQQLLRIERQPLQRFQNRIDQTETKQDAFRDLNNRVSNLTDRLDTLLDPSTFTQKKVENSSSEVLTASITDSDKVTEGTFDVFVEQLATPSEVKSGQVINDQKMVGRGGNATSISDFEVVEGSTTLDPSSDYLDALSKNVQTSGGQGLGDQDEFTITVDPGGGDQFSVGVDLDDFSNFQDLMDDVNQRLADNDPTGNQRLKMGFDSSEDKFFFIPLESGDDGGTDFELDGNEAAVNDNSRTFLQQIGITNDVNAHEFDERQSSIGSNLRSIDPSETFDNNLFTTQLDSNSGTILVNNTEIDFDSDSNSDAPSTLNELVDEINDSVQGVTASFNTATDKLTLETDNAGSGAIDVSDESGNLAEVLNINTEQAVDAAQAGGNQTGGQDAQVKIDGDVVTSTDNTVSFNGIELNLLQKHADDGNNDPVEITTGPDRQAATDEVQSFVDQFNSVIDFINSRNNADPPSEPGEESGSAGPFQGDITVRQLKSSLVQAVSERFKDATGSSEIQNASDIGIELVDPLNSSEQERGKISFDSAKFKDALEEQRDAVVNLFTSDTDDGDSADGLSARLQNVAEPYSDDILPSRIDGFDDRITSLQDRIDRQEERIQRKQDRLEQQFLRMEQLLAEFNSQSQFISARL